MKMKEIVEMSTDELFTKRRDLRQESLHLRLQQQSGQLEQPSRLRLLRRDIARIEAALSQRAKQALAQPVSMSLARGSRKTRTGEVISSSMDKTIVVRTVTRVPHPKFGKIVKQIKKFYAHDEQSQAKTGDTVRIIETRPLSKLKRWRLVEVIEK
jgi:small subunit ribosomal protein S17